VSAAPATGALLYACDITPAVVRAVSTTDHQHPVAPNCAITGTRTTVIVPVGVWNVRGVGEARSRVDSCLDPRILSPWGALL
jgi:hypothetical protein